MRIEPVIVEIYHFVIPNKRTKYKVFDVKKEQIKRNKRDKNNEISRQSSNQNNDPSAISKRNILHGNELKLNKLEISNIQNFKGRVILVQQQRAAQRKSRQSEMKKVLCTCKNFLIASDLFEERQYI